jgi:hypothetical protein
LGSYPLSTLMAVCGALASANNFGPFSKGDRQFSNLNGVFSHEGRYGGGKVQAQPYIGLRPMWRFARSTFLQRRERRLSVRRSIGSKPELSNAVKVTTSSHVPPTTRAKDLSMSGRTRSMTTAISARPSGRAFSIRSMRRIGSVNANGCGTPSSIGKIRARGRIKPSSPAISKSLCHPN